MIAALIAQVQSSPPTEGFWLAAARGELAIQTCLVCGHEQHPPRATCGACGSSDLEFRAKSGRGNIYSFTVVVRALIAELREQVPYVLVLVDLDDGPRVMSLLRSAPDEAHVGMAVQIAFESVGGLTLPVFRRQ